MAIFEWDGELVEGVDLIPASILDDADIVARRVESDFMVLGVVVDEDGTGPDSIPNGDDVLLATARVRCRPGEYEQRETPLRFRDNAHAVVEGGPLLDNILVVRGEAFGVARGLRVSDGIVRCSGRAGVEFQIVDGVSDPGSPCGTVPIRMTNPVNDVEGFVLAITHPAGLRLDEISIEGTATQEFGADFVQPTIFEEGGTLGVVMDLVSPLLGNVIPAAEEQVIANFIYCCVDGPDAPDGERLFDLRFEDGVLGQPAKDNLVVVDGVSSAPTVAHGTFRCLAISEICDDNVDNDSDGRTDCEDSDCAGSTDCERTSQTFALGKRRLPRSGQPDAVTATLGTTTEVAFFYNSPEDFVPGGPQFDQIQGVSMVVCFPCALQCQEDSLDISDTIVGAVEADFVDLQCDNDPNDGDGCELILGILVDALPPFDGGTLPPTDMFLRVGTVTFDVVDDQEFCGQTLPIEFCDGINGRGNVPIRNIVATENTAVRPMLRNNTVTFDSRPLFYRGDCDFNRRINVSDAANVVLTVFGTSANPHVPPCRDACDCNDDGRIDFADTICILRYMFLQGRAPLPPGPGFNEAGERVPPGEDPTDDELDCLGGGACSG